MLKKKKHQVPRFREVANVGHEARTPLCYKWMQIVKLVLWRSAYSWLKKKRVETCFSWWIEVFPGAETTIKLLCVSNSKVSNFLTELTEQHIVKSGIALRCKATQNCQKLTNLYIEPNYNIIKRCKMNKFIRIIDLWKKEAK